EGKGCPDGLLRSRSRDDDVRDGHGTIEKQSRLLLAVAECDGAGVTRRQLAAVVRVVPCFDEAAAVMARLVEDVDSLGAETGSSCRRRFESQQPAKRQLGQRRPRLSGPRVGRL